MYYPALNLTDGRSKTNVFYEKYDQKDLNLQLFEGNACGNFE
jgi:hypothetical protein